MNIVHHDSISRPPGDEGFNPECLIDDEDLFFYDGDDELWDDGLDYEGFAGGERHKV